MKFVQAERQMGIGDDDIKNDDNAPEQGVALKTRVKTKKPSMYRF